MAPSGNASYNLLDLENGTFDMGFTQEPNNSELVDEGQLNQIIYQLGMTRFIVWNILVPITVAFGVIGNCINIVVLTRRRMHTSTNVYLTALAICDVLYLVFGFVLGMKHYEGVRDSLDYWRFRKPFGMALADTFSNTGVWLTLTFTIERYIGVCHPLKRKVLCTPKQAKVVVVIVFMSTIILTFPEFFSFRSVTIVKDNVTSIVYEPLLEANSPYACVFKYTHQLLFTLGPLLSLLVLNTLLMQAMIQATKQRQTMLEVTGNHRLRQQREQQKITVMLIMVVLIFLLCQLPQAITNLYYSYLNVTKNLTPVVQYRIILTANVCNLLVMINSSCNFVLYSAFSTQFRNMFKQIFCKCSVKENTPAHVILDKHCNYGSKSNLIQRQLMLQSSQLSASPLLKSRPTINIVNYNKCKTRNKYQDVAV